MFVLKQCKLDHFQVPVGSNEGMGILGTCKNFIRKNRFFFYSVASQEFSVGTTSILVQFGQRIISSLVLSRLTHSAVMPIKQPPQL